ncbi:hypothetical protein [Neisseria weaveri]|uniref:hypothetical protein n=1 Tax=Neisseria weaveri TaxID=28091 RepID=UPI000D2F5A4B|nr:hypothetical protein [Neisseria weaveri]
MEILLFILSLFMGSAQLGLWQVGYFSENNFFLWLSTLASIVAQICSGLGKFKKLQIIFGQLLMLMSFTGTIVGAILLIAYEFGYLPKDLSLYPQYYKSIIIFFSINLFSLIVGCSVFYKSEKKNNYQGFNTLTICYWLLFLYKFFCIN